MRPNWRRFRRQLRAGAATWAHKEMRGVWGASWALSAVEMS